ncbi:MAG: hypothetical protein DWQ07_25110 [Chloroflexi bacterium]|nr:MAG: hypothetical protein DWQ07_25110 [Chloroflexota bacterium]MBL1196185.1 hypothetical protein [Chloroflexota bacterium]
MLNLKRILKIFFGLIFVSLTACKSLPTVATPTIIPNTETPTTILSTQTNQTVDTSLQVPATPTPENQISEEVKYILLRMLNSHTLWDSVKGTAELNWFYSSGNPKDTYSIDFFIKQPDIAYIDTRSKVGLGLPNLFITDGEVRYVVVEELDGYYQTEQDDITNQITSLPTNLDEVANVGLDAWKEGHHPFVAAILSPIESFVYPQWFAYGSPRNTYTLFGRQIYLDRNVSVIGYTNDRETYLAWVDEETGLILKFLRETVTKLDMEITSIQFDVDKEAVNLDFLAGLENLGNQIGAPYICFNELACSWGSPEE